MECVGRSYSEASPIVIGEGLNQDLVYLQCVDGSRRDERVAGGESDYGRLVDNIGDDGFVLFSTNQKEVSLMAPTILEEGRQKEISSAGHRKTRSTRELGLGYRAATIVRSVPFEPSSLN